MGEWRVTYSCTPIVPMLTQRNQSKFWKQTLHKWPAYWIPHWTKSVEINISTSWVVKVQCKITRNQVSSPTELVFAILCRLLWLIVVTLFGKCKTLLHHESSHKQRHFSIHASPLLASLLFPATYCVRSSILIHLICMYHDPLLSIPWEIEAHQKSWERHCRQVFYCPQCTFKNGIQVNQATTNPSTNA